MFPGTVPKGSLALYLLITSVIEFAHCFWVIFFKELFVRQFIVSLCASPQQTEHVGPLFSFLINFPEPAFSYLFIITCRGGP